MADIFVGSVSVGVVPDAKDFHNKLRDEIVPGSDRIGAEIGAEIGKAMRDAVRVYVDEIKADLKKGFKVDVEADTRQAKDEIDKAKAETEARPWHVRLHVDPGSLREIGQTIKARLKDSIGNLAIGGLAGGGIATGAAGLLAAVGPLGALTAGVGAFAALAIPELTKTSAALSKTGTAGQTAWKQLTPPERQLAGSITSIKDAFHGVQKELAPVVDSIVSMGVHTAKDLLPTLTLFARVGASIIRSFLTPFDAWIKSSSFQRLANQFAIFGDAAGRILGPQIVRLLKAFSNLFLQLLPSGIKVLGQLLPLITQLLVALTPGLVILAGVAAAVLKWINANHLLVPTIIAVAAAIVVLTGPTGLAGIIAATIAVALVVGLFAKHWKQWWADIKQWAEDAWNFLTHGWGQLLIPGLTAIRIVIELVRDHWRQAWNVIRDWARAVWNFLIHGIGQLLVPQVKQIWTIIEMVRDHWRAAWNDIKSIASSVWNALYNNVIHPFIRIVSNDLPGAFRTAVGVISRVWGTLRSIFLTPVRFLVNTVYDDGIARLWNDVMNKVGGPTLPVIPKFAAGGRIPGYGGGDIYPALLEPGETVVSKEHSKSLAGVFRAAGVPGYQLGGIIGGIGHAFSNIGHDIGSLFGGIGDVAKIITALVTGNSTAAINAFDSLIHTPAKAELATMMIGIPKKIISTGVHWALSHLESLLGAGGGGGHIGIGGGVARWAGTVKEVLALLGLPIADAGVVLAQMTTESGGNPFVVNKWDSNWAAGTPSVGLMQVIGPTFRAYAGPFRNVGPFAYGVSENPMANIYAGVNYAEHRYGPGWTSVLGHGHGYDDGGWWPSGTFGWNTSGQAEYVLTHDQAMNGIGGGDTYHLHFDGHGAVQAQVIHAMRVVDLHKGLAQRSGRRV